MKMLRLLKSVWLGVTLIVIASGILLLSDLNRRSDTRKSAKTLPRLAVMQWASTDLLDHTVEGIVEGLRRQGFENGRTAEIRFMNASGDNNTGNVMARDIAGGSYDLVLTASTLALQAVAKANSSGKVVHVFGGVTDPYGAGVGITGSKPDQHPGHLVGVGTFQPVERAIRIARQMNPKLQKIGTVWNPGESNSEACVGKARATCKELGMELIEANAGNTSEVPEAIRSVLARGAEAVWVGGDTVAISSLGAIISAARARKIPVFSNDPGDTAKGALFGVGASYRDVGMAVGEIAGEILKGASPRSFGVENLVPELLSINEAMAKELGGWSVTDELRAQAAASSVPKSSAVQRKPEPGRTYKIGVLYFCPHPLFDMTIEGIRSSLREAGFVEGRNLAIEFVHPNGDMSMLPQVARNIAGQNPDILMPLSTTCLAAALANRGGAPIVFGAVSSPIEAGAGKSETDHLPGVTGAIWTAPDPALFKWLAEIFPECRNVGLVYNPSDANSMREKETARALLAKQGMTLVERTVGNSSEITSAVQSLVGNVNAVFGMGDTTAVSAFTALSQTLKRAKIPLVADDNSLMGTGAVFSCGANPFGEGRHAGRMAARVLLGENPSVMPFEPSTEFETAVDFAESANLGVSFPLKMLKGADVFHHASARIGRPFRVSIVNLVRNPSLDEAEAGVLQGLRESGFREKEDFTVKRLNAQGETAQLPAMLDSALADSPDLIVTVTTPALVAAAHRVTGVPVVFTVASDPAVLGLFNAGNRPANIAGVHDDPPMERLLEMACRLNPSLKIVGIIYDPAQPNSLISVGKLRKACGERGFTLCEATATGTSELAAAAQSVVQRQAGAIMLSADNLVSTGFSVIHDVAQRAGVPVYVTDTELVKQGADGAVGDNYRAWGMQSGRLAAKVLAGVPPCDLPIAVTKNQEIIEPVKTTASASVPRQSRTRPWEIRIARYNDAQFSADTWRGIMDGFKKQGLQEGRDFNMRCLNAQGDMATLSGIMTSVRSERPDILMTISTPTLQAALRQAGDLPVVFGCVADAVHAGAGKSDTDHLPNVTGITTLSPFAPMAKLIKMSVPKARAVGTLFSPGEINAELNRQWFAEALEKEGLKLVSIPVNGSAEVADAAGVMLRSDIQVVCQIMDNTARPGFAQLAKRAKDAGLPFFCFDSSGVREGATLALGRDYYFSGIEAAEVAVRVLRGAKTAQIPIVNTRTEIVVVNPELIRKYGITLPPEYLKIAKEVKTGD